ncbi:DUF2691 family protein [Ectobacillus antri]|uniref:DUF2691 family protein n=1 Tax=Ectobacillus antri TaxID=2486280 RepID=UPI000F5AE47D|nr:DUF2691 family protein [Ectobacillus antri]
MEHIGVRFRAPGDENTMVSILQLLEFVDIETYMWQVTNHEIYIIKDDGFVGTDGLFGDRSSVYSGKEIELELTGKKYYAISISLRGFPKHVDKNEIENFYLKDIFDFPQMSCELILNLVDNDYLFFLCKDETLLDVARNHFKNIGCYDITYITST